MIASFLTLNTLQPALYLDSKHTVLQRVASSLLTIYVHVHLLNLSPLTPLTRRLLTITIPVIIAILANGMVLSAIPTISAITSLKSHSLQHVDLSPSTRYIHLHLLNLSLLTSLAGCQLKTMISVIIAILVFSAIPAMISLKPHSLDLQHLIIASTFFLVPKFIILKLS